MQADGSAGFEGLFRSGDSCEVACMADIRRRFAGIHRARGSAIADQASARIAPICAGEKKAGGLAPDRRVEIRQVKAAPIFDDVETWLHLHLPGICGKAPLVVAIRYALTRRKRTRPHPGLQDHARR